MAKKRDKQRSVYRAGRPLKPIKIAKLAVAMAGLGLGLSLLTRKY